MTDVQLDRIAPVHLDLESLEAGLADVQDSPKDNGELDLIVRRPAIDEREILEVAQLSLTEGVVGDTWNRRGSGRTSDSTPHPDMQLNIINARLSRLISGGAEDDRALAGDQLHVDLDLSEENLPAWTRLAIGGAVIQVTDQPHTGCPKFAARFGPIALRFVNFGVGRQLRLRGINAKVLQPGTIRRGDRITKLS